MPKAVRIRAGVLLLALVVVLGLADVVAGPVQSAEAAGCRAPQVAVVVDFGHWGGARNRGCATGDPGLTGVGALEQAGFAVSGTARYGVAFVCRIDNLPTPAHERCVDTPPATAYWSYWHADPGQTSWTYTSLGASQYHPEPGSVDAWTFGGTDVGGTSGQPGFSPADVMPGPARSSAPPSRSSPSPPGPRPSQTRPSQTRRSTPRSTPAIRSTEPPPPTTAGPSQRTGAGSGASPSATRTRAATSVNGSTVVGGSSAGTPGAGSIGSSSGPVIVDNPSARAPSAAGSGSPLASVIGLGVIAMLVLGVAVVVRRRRAGR